MTVMYSYMKMSIFADLDVNYSFIMLSGFFLYSQAVRSSIETILFSGRF